MNQNDDDLVGRLQQLGAQPIDPATQAMHLTAMGAGRARRPATSKLRIAAALVAGFMLGSTGLAAADALPDPVQHVAHTALKHVGVDVPNPARYHGPECGAEVKRNHGAYVSADHALAKTECGKPIHDKSKDKSKDANGTNPKATDSSDDKGPCHGKPPWAGKNTLTPEEKAAAEAARKAQCPDDESGTETETETETNQSATVNEPTTTTTEAVTTTTSTATTEAPAVDEEPSTTTTTAT